MGFHEFNKITKHATEIKWTKKKKKKDVSLILCIYINIYILQPIIVNNNYREEWIILEYIFIPPTFPLSRLIDYSNYSNYLLSVGTMGITVSYRRANFFLIMESGTTISKSYYWQDIWWWYLEGWEMRGGGTNQIIAWLWVYFYPTILESNILFFSTKAARCVMMRTDFFFSCAAEYLFH